MQLVQHDPSLQKPQDSKQIWKDIISFPFSFLTEMLMHLAWQLNERIRLIYFKVSILFKVHIHLRCLGGTCIAVLLWSSRNLFWTIHVWVNFSFKKPWQVL